MAGFVRFVSVQKYVSVQMVIADYGGATPPYGPYTSGSQISRSNFPGYPNGFTGGVPLSRPQFYPNGYGYTGGVPLSRPNGYVYTEVWQEEDISEEVDDVQVKKGDYESHVLQKCCKFLADCFHQFYVNFKEFLYDFKQFLADWFREFYDNFKEFLYDFKQFLYNLEHYIDRSTVFLEHCAEFMDRLSRIMKEWNDMENLANNGTQAGDSYHCYHYYNNNYNNNNNNSGCCPCIGFRRGGAPSLSNGVNQRGVRREEVVQKCCEGYKNSGCCPCSGFRIRRGASSLSNGDNHPGVRQEEVVQNAANGADYVTPQPLIRRIMEEILIEEILIIVMIWFIIIADVVGALDFKFKEEAALPHPQIMSITKESGGKKWCRNAANGADYVTPQELMRRIMEEILMWEEILIIVMIWIFIILGIKIADVVRALDFEFEEALPHSQMMTITKESGGKNWCRNAANGADYVTPQELMRRIMEEILMWEEILMIWIFIILGIKIADVVRALDFEFEEALPHSQMMTITKESGGKKWCRNAANGADYVTPQELMRRIMEEILMREEILIIVMIWFIIIVFIKIAVVVRALDFKFEEAALPHPQMVAITKESGGKKRCRNAANAANYVTPQQLRRIELKQ